MRFFIYTLALTTFSLLLHSVVQYILMRTVEWPTIEEIRFVFVIGTMLFVVIVSYLIFRKVSGKITPPFIQTFLMLFVVQLISIAFLTLMPLLQVLLNINLNFAPDAVDLGLQFEDLLIKLVVFGVVLPIIIQTTFFLINRKESIISD